MKIIGITGRSGAGKSTVAKGLCKVGAAHIDADKVAHALQRKGTLCYGEIVSAFDGICDENGEIERKKLASIVFSSPERMRELEMITHKHIGAEIDRLMHEAKRSGSKAVIIEAIAIIESGIVLDVLVAVTADYEEQISRIMSRDDITREQAEKRLSAQKQESFFTERADIVVNSNCDIKGLAKQLGITE